MCDRYPPTRHRQADIFIHFSLSILLYSENTFLYVGSFKNKSFWYDSHWSILEDQGIKKNSPIKGEKGAVKED